MKKDKLSRRDFFVRATAVGAVTVGSSAFLAACGGGESNSNDTGNGAAEAPASDGGEMMASADCTDLSGLTDAEIQTRTSLQYVEKTENPDQRCDNCQLYTQPEEGADCGGCQIIKGPIAPEGYCISWAAVQS